MILRKKFTNAFFSSTMLSPEETLTFIRSKKAPRRNFSNGKIVYSKEEMNFGHAEVDWLKNFVRLITKSVETETSKAMAWVHFLRYALAHSYFPLENEDGTMAYSPYRLLVDGYSQCGQTARLVVDGLHLIGIKSRLIQLNGHVSAEFWNNTRWIFAEADIIAENENLINYKGEFASIDDLIENPKILSQITPMKNKSSNASMISDYAWREEADKDWPMAFKAIKYEQSPLSTPYEIKRLEIRKGKLENFKWDHYVFEERTEKNQMD